ncbi:unnamed protein product [Paramecium sonneborni]|uniref:Uncharacterized protein n=1 Tax=Paramecium sonneborni TaxID=65129 RepID=A0A8S1QA24_9CILI|nr:unnamed protein product [Paramecium sonneborni]
MGQNIEIDKNIHKENFHLMSTFTAKRSQMIIQNILLLKKNNQIIRQSLYKMIQAYFSKVELDDTKGYEDIKQAIRKLVEWPLKYPEQFKKIRNQRNFDLWSFLNVHNYITYVSSVFSFYSNQIVLIYLLNIIKICHNYCYYKYIRFQ